MKYKHLNLVKEIADAFHIWKRLLIPTTHSACSFLLIAVDVLRSQVSLLPGIV